MSKNSRKRRQSNLLSQAKLAEFWLAATEQHDPSDRLALLHKLAEIRLEYVGSWDLDARRQHYERQLRNRPLSKVCFVCRKRATQQHHVILLSRGGDNSYLNLVPICKTCHEDVHPWMREGPSEATESECAQLDACYRRAVQSPFPVIDTFQANPTFTVTYAWLHGEASTGNSCGWTYDILRLLNVDTGKGKGPKKGWLSRCVGSEISLETKAKIEAIAAKNKRDFQALKTRMDKLASHAVTSPVAPSV